MKRLLLLNAILLSIFLTGCTGLNTFPVTARAGDTISLATGWKKEFTQDKITVTFVPEVGDPIEYLPADPGIRGVVNMYPDPVSWLVVGTEIGTGVNSDYDNGSNFGGLVNSLFTSGDGDWWETSVFIDLPPSLPVGPTNITITSTSGESYGPVPVQIEEGTGNPTAFSYEPGGALLIPEQFKSMGRASHFVIDFTGPTVPYSIQIDMSHTPAESAGGVGRPHVINTRGDIKSLSWSDDGENMRVLITPVKGQTLNLFRDFKFYVSGGITDLTVKNIQAFDIDGNPVADMIATIQPG